MSEMEEKLGAILNNPQMMQQILSMAQSMGGGPPQAPSPEPSAQDSPSFDPALLSTLGSIIRKSGVDPNQKTLLSALSPYVSRSRASKLEKAMRAARLAEAASSFLGAGGLSMLTGR